MNVSCIIPVYNAGIYLSDAINSILNQTYNDFEIVIIDDCSTDESWKIIKDFEKNHPSKIKALKNEKNKGLPGTLNRAIKESKGTYIARMDQDDIALPTRFEEQLATFEKNPDVSIVGTYWQYMNNGVIPDVPEDFEAIKAYTLLNNPIGHPTVMFKKNDIVKKVGYYNESAHTIEDFEFWCRCLERVKAINIPKPLLKYRIHSAQISSSSSNKQHNEAFRIRVNQAKKVLISKRLSEYFVKCLDKPLNENKSLILFSATSTLMLVMNIFFRKYSSKYLLKIIAKKILR